MAEINPLDKQAALLIEAKDNEKAWNKERVRIEGEIAKIVGVKDEGTITIETDKFKVKTVGKVNRTMSLKEALALKTDINEPAYKRLFSWKPSLLVKELDWLKENEPETYAIALKRVTSKSAKDSVSVEAVE